MHRNQCPVWNPPDPCGSTSFSAHSHLASSGARIHHPASGGTSVQAGAGGDGCLSCLFILLLVIESGQVWQRWWSQPWKDFMLQYNVYVYYKLKSAVLLLFPKGICSDEWFNCLAWKLADNYSCYSFQPKLLSWELNSSLLSCLHASHFLLSLTQWHMSVLPLSGWICFPRHVQLCFFLGAERPVNAHIKYV